VSGFEFIYKSSSNDDLLYVDGPVIEVEITVPLPLVRYLRKSNLPAYPLMHGLAIIDTGAAITAIDAGVLEKLGIPYIDTELMHTVHGSAEMQMFNASANFPSLELGGISLDRVPGGSIRSATNAGTDIIMLLGREILRNLKMTYDGPNSKVTITT